MSVKALSEVAETYFSTLNPIAERISEDIEAVRDAYEDLWRCLSQHEREQIINETVIFPEAILKYALSSKSTPYDVASLDVFREPPRITGSKYIVDDSTGLSWRDEHSGPFSWKTPSQMDLSIFGSSKSHAEDAQLAYNNAINKDVAKKVWSIDDDCRKSNGFKKALEAPDSPNVVLGGTCSKISGLCSKLKFLPGKSFSYEVKTVVSGSGSSHGDVNILEKIRASAVNKIQNTIKFVGGKSYGSAADKKMASEVEESENLVQGAKESVAIVRLQKPSPRVNKPKSPPPPPPPPPPLPPAPSVLQPDEKVPTTENDSEEAVLLPENSVHSLDRDSLASKVVHDLSDDIKSLSTECTPLSLPSFDNIPKSGFDFLDNW